VGSTRWSQPSFLHTPHNYPRSHSHTPCTHHAPFPIGCAIPDRQDRGCYGHAFCTRSQHGTPTHTQTALPLTGLDLLVFLSGTPIPFVLSWPLISHISFLPDLQPRPHLLQPHRRFSCCRSSFVPESCTLPHSFDLSPIRNDIDHYP
jgi:hypothetical protein